MTVLQYFLRRLRALWRSDDIHDEISDEMRFHIELRAEENVRRGMTPDEARREAERQFGRFDLIKEEGYDVRGGRWLEATWQDLRYGARMLLKSPGFTATVLLTLALGIGANITIFSVVNAVLLRPLPYHDPDRLAVLWTEAPKQNVKERTSAYATISDWRQQNTSFEDLAIFDPTMVMLTGADEAERSQSFRTSANLFKLLGVTPALGRTFTADEEQQKARVVILSHGLWQRRFGASPNILLTSGNQ
jgi:hypothetical protein